MAMLRQCFLVRLVRPLYHRPLRLHWIDPHDRISPRLEAFDFNFCRAFGKEWVAVDHAVRLACKFVCVGNLSCRTVPKPIRLPNKTNRLWPSRVAICRFPKRVAIAERT